MGDADCQQGDNITLFLATLIARAAIGTALELAS